jgi:2,5-diamino-6-(ribosylamino)-4(3H)-pyrimidinone 5'-phosphate reductase
MEEQPRPVILDPNRRARLPKLLHLVASGEAKSPWIFCRDEGEPVDGRHFQLGMVDGRFSWDDILPTLWAKGVKSVMVEGGANVISDVLSKGMADVIIITIAPVFIGRDGVGILPSLHTPEWLHDSSSIIVGKDMVIAGRMKR